MIIGIDARFIGRPGGIGRYTEELVRSLALRAARHELVLFLRDEGFAQLAQWTPANVRKVRAEVPWYTLAEQMRMPGILDRERLDVVHFPHWNVPLRVRTPFVLTIHDLLLLEHPTRRASTLDPIRYAIKSAAHRLVLRSAVQRAQTIIVPSEFVAEQVREYLPRATNKIVVIPEGVHEAPHPHPLPRGEGSRILYVGNAYPHKNLERLLRAFVILRLTHPEAELILAGYDDYFFRRLRDFAVRERLVDNVRFIPSPKDDTLEQLYRSAGIFVIPSLTEGFGLTPLEAMARGIPVVSSRGGSLPEALGDAALYADPRDVGDLAAALRRTVEDEPLRQKLINAGREQAAHYSWVRAAQQTLEVYEHQEGTHRIGT